MDKSISNLKIYIENEYLRSEVKSLKNYVTILRIDVRSMGLHADTRQTCDRLIAPLRDSDLNFLVQDNPFSAFITIRNTLYRGLDPVKRVSDGNKIFL